MRISKLVPGEWGSLRPAAAAGPRTPQQIEEKARAILAELSLEEKVCQMSGDDPRLPGLVMLALAYNRHPIPAGENFRLKIPGIRFSDGPRGVVMGHATCFPVSMGRGATWDPALEEQVGDAIGVEARALGANFYGGVCINLLRHPAWGRAQETYGEDPFLLGRMGSALVSGVQRHIMACVKHYALNSIENNRQKVNVQVSERTLREVYLPHFKRCIDAGAAAVMSAYNQVNGEYCGQNHHLLHDILKDEWGFQGFVVSDFYMGIYDAQKAALAGLDIEMPLQFHYRAGLVELVKAGQVPQAVIDEAVLRILRQKLRFAQVGEPGRYGKESVFSPEHRALARRVAQESIVLLKNEPAAAAAGPVLPLDPTGIQRLAVIGELAQVENTGDHGSSRVYPPQVVTLLEGIRAAVSGQVQVVYESGRNLRAAQRAARKAQAVVVCAGFTYRDEGEKITAGRGGDRLTLALSELDEAMIRAVAEANPNTIVVLVGGSAILTGAWSGLVPAILMAWYPGSEGGHAAADILFGKVNPSGKLPCVFPANERQLPFFDSAAAEIEYGYYHGYRLLDKNGDAPAFPFGFGLSYTSYQCHNLRLSQPRLGLGGALLAQVEVTNTGSRPGEEVVQLYVGCEGSKFDRPVRELKGFTRLALQPGQTRTAEIALPAADLACYDEAAAGWVVEPIRYTVWVGPSSRAEDLLKSEFTIEGG